MLLAGFALAKLAFHLFTSSGYGTFRDELYYLACADHLAWGYVDHPPLSIAVLWIARGLFGDSLPALRLVPALAGAATVALVGAMARGLGGGRWAQALAMSAALAAPIYLGLDHYYSMNALDLLFWALAATLVARLLATPETDRATAARLWLFLGAVLGLGLLNKISVLWLGFGLAVGLVTTPERRWLRTPWPWLAGAIAAALFTPHLLWQAANDWPTLEFMRNATREKMVDVAPLDFVATQIEVMNPAALPLWLAGLAWLLVRPAARPYRLLGWAFVAVFALLMVSGSSRAGYLAPAYTWLLAAGGVAAERVGARPRRRWLGPAALALLLGAGAALAPLAVPLLPVERHIAYARALGQAPSTEERKEVAELGQFFADMHGWEEIVAALAEAHRRLPPEERAAARVFAPDYGVAGAVDFFGRPLGLPAAISGHNNYWLWGPRGWDGRVLIVAGGAEERLRALFAEVERAGTIECGRCMPYENHSPIWIARRLRMPISAVWPEIKHFD